MAHANDHLSYDQHQDVESHDRTYLKVFFALLVFTLLEYFYAKVSQDHFGALVLGLMAMAITKATLVAMYFMHLKFEGRWVYFMLVPAGVLAVGLVLALMPDIGTRPVDPADTGEDELVRWIVPSPPASHDPARVPTSTLASHL